MRGRVGTCDDDASLTEICTFSALVEMSSTLSSAIRRVFEFDQYLESACACQRLGRTERGEAPCCHRKPMFWSSR